MRRRYKANSFDSLVEDGLDLISHILSIQLRKAPADAVIADLMILAVDTLQVAVGEKNIADPFRSADDRFFTPVNADTGDVESGITPAKTIFILQAVNMAITRAPGAILQHLQRILNNFEWFRHVLTIKAGLVPVSCLQLLLNPENFTTFAIVFAKLA